MKFSKLVWTGAAILWTASLGGMALAQDAPAAPAAPEAGAAPRGGGQGRGGQGRGGYNAAPTLATLPISYMSAMLDLKDEQKTKIQAIQAKVQTDLQDLRKPDADGNRPSRATIQPKMKEINDQAKKDIEAVLTPEQLKKSETVLKTAGIYNSVGIPLGAVADLKLTSDEDTKLAAIAADAAKADATTKKDIADAQGDQQKIQDLMKARQDARKATQEKALAVLTEEQKTTLTKYQKDHPAPQRGNRQAPPAAPAPAGNGI